MNKELNLILPVEGRWLVVWGGDNKEQNRHHDDPIQKYAFDMVKENDQVELGEWKQNDEFSSFGSEVSAPADGMIVEAVDGVRDNAPGCTNTLALAGNHVLIRHTTNLFSFIAHFQQYSLKVKAGDKVKQGDLLGLCGNSGNSSQPHLHFHLQDSEHFYKLDKAGNTKPIANAVKCYFSELTVENKHSEPIKKTNYSPIRGDIISK